MKVKVLLIEDDPETKTAISLSFQMQWPEAEIISSDTGEKGIQFVKSADPDVVILDLGLPDINGLEVLKLIREVSSVPIIVLTVWAKQFDVDEILGLGANDYVAKPFKQSEFVRRVKALVTR